MVNAKTTPYIVYFLVAAVIVFALAAIIASRFREPSDTLGVSRDCVGTTAYQDFDFDIRVSGPGSNWTERGEVSGGDFKSHISFSDGMFADFIALGGQGYSNDNNEGWKEDEYVAISTVFAHIGGNDYAKINIICPASLPEWVDSVREAGRGQYKVTASDGAWSYWVGDDGLLIRTLSVDGPHQTEATISNVGDPNVIERPPGV